MNAHSKPRLFALGGSQANTNFSKSEVAEVLLYDRFLSQAELNGISEYLRLKWLGGSLQNFPLLVRLSPAEHPSFDLSTFADPSSGGDLRFQDEHNRELAFEIDVWNASGESLVGCKLWNSPAKRNSGYWGNQGSSTLPSYTIWNGYEAVWHLADLLDSSASDNNLSSSGSPSIVSTLPSVQVLNWMEVRTTGPWHTQV